MGQCKTTNNIELESLNVEAMSYPWTINTTEVQKNEVKTIKLKLLNWMKPSFLAIGMLKNQSMVFMSPRQGKNCVQMKNICSCGANVSQIKEPPNIGTILIIPIIQDRVEEKKIIVWLPRRITKILMMYPPSLSKQKPL